MAHRTLGAIVALGLVGGFAAPAYAAPSESSNRPSWAGPPMVGSGPVTESDPPTFLCDGRELVFTGGLLTFRGRSLPGDRFFSLIKLRGATASDGDTTYRAVGGGKFMGTNDGQSGMFNIRITFVARGGGMERVNTTSRISDGEASVTDRGTCTVQE